MKKSDDEELKSLALHLKDICDVNGKEIDHQQSAEIIYKIGLVYLQQNSDKIALIKGVGLLNSAIVRNSANDNEMKNQLLITCQNILHNAKARNQTINLINYSQVVKQMVNELRKETNHMLKKMNDKCKTSTNKCQYQNMTELKNIQEDKTVKIVSMQKIQNRITMQYKKIMHNISYDCEMILGPPPCKFVIVGMGSLARKEITPYSDFEHIILLENDPNYENHLEYFRWFSVIFHTIVLNLQETIIPSLNIKYLNDKTSELGDWYFDVLTSGISFDGMMVHACKFPLGRTKHTKNKPWTTELIKPVDKMLEYLSSDVSLKNGYHLSDILTETCFVYGEQSLHDEFKNGVILHKNSKTGDELLDEIRLQVKDDFNNFATRIRLVNLKPNSRLNVKQMFYRTSTLFITALGKICQIKSSSCFDIIKELAEQQKISANTKHKLSYAVAIACEIRLRVYMKEQSQRDYIQPRKNAETVFDEILKIIDKESIISYLQITYCLQLEITKILGLDKAHLYSNARLLNITICYALRLDALMLSLMINFKESSSSIYFSDGTDSGKETAVDANKICIYFDKYLANVENEIENCESNINSTQPDLFSLIDILNDITAIDDNKNFEENIELLNRVVEILQRKSLREEYYLKVRENENTSIDLYIAHLNMMIVALLVAVKKFKEALLRINQAFESFNAANNDSVTSALFYKSAGENCILMKNYEKSLTYMQIALSICLSDNLDQRKLIDEALVAMMYTSIGICLLNLEHYKESLNYLKIAVEIIRGNDLECTWSLFFNPASTYHNLGKCLVKLQNFKEALPCFFQALVTAAKYNPNDENDVTLTEPTKKVVLINRKIQIGRRIFHDLGLLYIKQHRFKEALSYLEKSFKMHNKLSDSEEVAETRVALLHCYMEIYQRERVENYLKALHDDKKLVTIKYVGDCNYQTYAIEL